MKKIILMLCTTILCNSFHATIVNKVMENFKTTNKEDASGRNKIWYSNISYKRPIFSTKNGNKTKDINLIAQATTQEALGRFADYIKINISTSSDLTIKIHNALVKYLKSANRKAIYIYVPTSKTFANATDSTISREKSTKDYTIIPVQKVGENEEPAYVEIIAKRKNALINRSKVEHSNITIKLTQPDAGPNTNTSTEGVYEGDDEESDE